MAVSPECQKYLNQLENVVDTIERVVGAASKVFKTLKGLLEKMQITTEPDLTLIETAAPAYGADLVSDISSILNCTVVADSPEGARLAEALDYLNQGTQVPADTQDEINKDSRKTLSKRLDELKKASPVAKIDKAQASYERAIAKAGVKTAIQTADALYNCIYSACQTSADVIADADSAMTRLDEIKAEGHLTPEGDVTDLVADNSSIPQDVKDEYSVKKQDLTDAKTYVQNFSLPW